MIKQLKSLQLSGVKRNKPQLSGELGDCEEIINLRFKGGAWRGVGKKDKKSYSIRSSRVILKLYMPALFPDSYMIGYCSDTNALVLFHAIETGLSTDSVILQFVEGETFKSLAWLNNVLIAYTDKDSYFMNYSDTGVISTMVTVLNKLSMPKFQVGELEASRELLDVTENITVNDEESLIACIGRMAEKYSLAKHDGKFFGNVSFMIAYKLQTGDYILQEGPFVWTVGFSTNPDNIPHADVLVSPFSVKMYVYVSKPLLWYSYSESQKATLEAYKEAGILRSLCIFMTPEKSAYDPFDDQHSNWKHSEVNPEPENPNVSRRLDCPYNENIQKTNHDAIAYYLVKELTVDDLLASGDFSNLVLTLDKGLLQAIETQPTMPVDSFSHHALIPETSYLYNSRLHLADIRVIPGQMPLPFVHAFYDSFPRWWEITDIADIKALYLYGLLPEQSEGVLTGIDLYLCAEIKTDGHTYRSLRKLLPSEVTLYYSESESVRTYYTLMRPFAAYPDNRAVKYSLLANYPGTDTNLKVCEVDLQTDHMALEPLSFHNASVYNKELLASSGELWLPMKVHIPTNLSEYNSLVNYNEAKTSPLWQEHNRMQTSEVNNLFFYPAKNSYRIGNPEYYIRALIVAQEQMSESQFGQYPLYAFTSEGIYAFEYQGGEVLYNRIHQFVNDVIQSGSVPVAVLGGAIVFMCEDGVRILQGRQTKLISEEITHRTLNPLMDQPLLVEMTSTASISLLNALLDNTDDMKAYLHSCSIGYDAIEKELLFAPQISAFANDPNGFTLVYSLVNGTWSKRSDSFKGFIRDGNEYLAINNKVVESVNTSDFFNLNVESGVMDKPWTFFQTRPFSFGSEVPKRMLQDILRITGENKAVYETRYYDYDLNLPVNNALYGTTSGGGTYVEGTVVAISATAEAGYEFVRWVEDGETFSEDATSDVVMTGDRVITAEFELSAQPFIFTVKTTVENKSFTLPTSETWWSYEGVEQPMLYNAMVDYGDGSDPVLVNAFDSSNATHIYATPGEYDVKISGLFEVFYQSEDIGIIEVKQYGNSAGFKALNFAYQSGLAIIPNGPITGLGDTPDLSRLLYECPLIVSIPTNLLINAVSCKTAYAAFYNTGITSIPSTLLDTCVALKDVGLMFASTDIASIPVGLFDNNTSIIDFDSTFSDCTLLTLVPNDLFKFNPLAFTFGSTFKGCILLTSVPETLFKYNTEVTTFAQTFLDSGLLTIPAELFRYNVLVNTFEATFMNCYGITSIPSGLFIYNILVDSFYQVFATCIGITTVPVDLFRYNTVATTFDSAFSACDNLESISVNLFKYNTEVINFVSVFANCEKLQVNRNVFYADGEHTTRFLNLSVDFTNSFSRINYSGIQGEAPELWACDFGTGTPTKTQCYSGSGNSLTSLSNYASIPADWK